MLRPCLLPQPSVFAQRHRGHHHHGHRWSSGICWRQRPTRSRDDPCAWSHCHILDMSIRRILQETTVEAINEWYEAISRHRPSCALDQLSIFLSLPASLVPIMRPFAQTVSLAYEVAAAGFFAAGRTSRCGDMFTSTRGTERQAKRCDGRHARLSFD